MVSAKVDLAHEASFALGRLTVRPPQRELVCDDGTREVLEHRVMRVLIALAKAQGAIVTRDELIDCCWDGRIVGDDAINRVISMLRKVAEGIGAGSFSIETATKIGYSLAHDGAATPAARGAEPDGRAPPFRPSRRAVLAVVATAGAFAAGGGTLLYGRLARPPVAPDVLALLSQARNLGNQNTREGQYQAIGLARRAVELAPDFADGWGELGIHYGVTSHYRERAEGEALRARAEAAGRRALELDPGNAYGELALSVSVPFIGHWKEREHHLVRARTDRPDNDLVVFYSAVALNFLGQDVESLPYYQRIRQRPFLPAQYNNYIRALWCAGRMEEADRAMEDATSLYPSQATLWTTRFEILVFTGRPNEAMAMIQNVEGRPSVVGNDTADMVRWAQAMQSRDPAAIDAIMALMPGHARSSGAVAQSAIRAASGFGRLDEAFALADAYYFGRSFVIADFAPGSGFSPKQRQTRLLFEPVTAPMRADPRFERLVEEIGLDRYWRESGAVPDYRRA